MHLDIRADVFADGDRFSVAKLLDLAMTGRHHWRPDRAAAESAARFAEKLPFEGVKNFVEHSLVETLSSAAPVGTTAVVTVNDLKDLVADLSRPAVLVVEDEITEGRFLFAISGAFKEPRIVEALEKEWLTLGHAGSEDRMESFVARRRRQFAVLVRVAALLDSDQGGPEHRTRNHTYAMRIRAIDGVNEVHMWCCRGLENYIPCRVWEHHFPARGPKVDSLRRMPLRQRRYLDVKRHFGGSLPRPLIPKELALTEEDFAELGPALVDELRQLLAMIHRIL